MHIFIYSNEFVVFWVVSRVVGVVGYQRFWGLRCLHPLALVYVFGANLQENPPSLHYKVR